MLGSRWEDLNLYFINMVITIDCILLIYLLNFLIPLYFHCEYSEVDSGHKYNVNDKIMTKIQCFTRNKAHQVTNYPYFPAFSKLRCHSRNVGHISSKSGIYAIFVVCQWHYRTITLLSQLSKLFTRMKTKQSTNKLDGF